MTTGASISEEPKGGQIHAPYRPVFSLVMGIIAPVLCIALQPVLLSGMVDELPGLRFLNAFPFLNYGVVALNVLAMATWLGLGCRVGKWGGVVSGVLFTGSVFAGLLGVVLLPFSLIGLFAVVGVLGFTPLFTAYVFLRNGIRALRLARPRSGFWRLRSSLLLGVVLAVGIPGAIQAQVSWAARSAISGIVRGEPNATAMLRRWHAIVYGDSLVRAYQVEQDQVRKGRLAKAYKDLCGEDLETRFRLLDD